MNLNATKILKEYRSKLRSGEIFSKSDNQILIELLEKSNDQFESSSIIEILGKISWSRKFIENEYIDQVHSFLTNPNNPGFGSFAARSACEWIFTQWIGIGEDTIKKYSNTFLDILKGASWDEIDYDAQSIIIKASGNYLQNHKNTTILVELIKLCNRNKPLVDIKDEAECSILNLNNSMRYDDTILALRTALKIQEETYYDKIYALANERLLTENQPIK